MLDLVAEFYSKPQMGGGKMRPTSRRSDSYVRYAIPLIPNRTAAVKKAVAGASEAVRMAGGKAVAKFVHDKNNKPGPVSKEGKSDGVRERFTKSASGAIGVEAAKSKKPKKKKHKRSRIDELLGDDSY